MDDTDETRPERPDSSGPNVRPRDTTIAQTGECLPDDSGKPVQFETAEANVSRTAFAML